MLNILPLLGLALAATLTGSTVPASPSIQSAAATVAASPKSCGTHVGVDDSGNGSTVCVRSGGDLTVILKTAGSSSWSTPAVTGHVLGPPMALPTPYGRVGWQFGAIAAGQSEITTTRPAGCHAVTYRLYVTVR
jgi:hypothetical protein